MDQHEKDWLDLGRQLKNYHPAGDSDDAFKKLQELQRQEPVRKKRGAGFWLSDNLLLLVLLPFLGLIAYSVGKGEWERYQNKNAPPTATYAKALVKDQVPPKAAVAIIEEVTTLPESNTAIPTPPFVKDSSSSVAIDGKLLPGATERATAVYPSPDALDVAAKVVNTNTASAAVEPTLAKAHLTDQSADRLAMALETLPIAPIRMLPPALPEVPAPPTVITQQPTNLKVTLGTGLSNHWRGANFMQEVDRGIYAYVGVYRRIGKRLGLEGRIGYRGHGMQLPVVNDTKAPWSYYKEEIHNTGHMGEPRAYIYEGVVEGYQAIEFSLLANYQVSSKLNLTTGFRYALPDLAFEQTVVGPDEENPFFEFIERQPLVKYHDYGALFGAEYRFSRNLALEAGLHLGMVDLIDDSAEARTWFNHSSSLSLGVRYILE